MVSEQPRPRTRNPPNLAVSHLSNPLRRGQVPISAKSKISPSPSDPVSTTAIPTIPIKRGRRHVNNSPRKLQGRGDNEAEVLIPPSSFCKLLDLGGRSRRDRYLITLLALQSPVSFLWEEPEIYRPYYNVPLNNFQIADLVSIQSIVQKKRSRGHQSKPWLNLPN